MLSADQGTGVGNYASLEIYNSSDEGKFKINFHFLKADAICKQCPFKPSLSLQVILQNLEAQGVLKGGSVAVHMNRNMPRQRSRSPNKVQSAFEYIPSPIQKQKVYTLFSF